VVGSDAPRHDSGSICGEAALCHYLGVTPRLMVVGLKNKALLSVKSAQAAGRGDQRMMFSVR
jgi:hypothetical protein